MATPRGRVIAGSCRMKENWRRSHQRQSEGRSFVECSSVSPSEQVLTTAPSALDQTARWSYEGTLQLALEKDRGGIVHNFQQLTTTIL